ncbi:MAG: Crp/Fnr family transcriptional regulator [Parvibaculaceae bacterium]
MTSASQNEIATALKRNMWFRRQTPRLRAALSDAAIITTAEAGHWIYDVGDKAFGLYGVISGSVRILVQMADGDYALANIVGTGAIFGYAGRFAGKRRLVTAVARGEARLLFISETRLEAIARDEPDLWIQFGELAFDHLVAAMRANVINTHESPEARIAMHLRGFAGDEAERTELAISQEELAELTGLSRKTVNQVLATLVAKGAIKVGYRRIDLIDAGKLLVAPQ